MVRTPVAWAVYYSVLLPQKKFQGFRELCAGNDSVACPKPGLTEGVSRTLA